MGPPLDKLFAATRSRPIPEPYVCDEMLHGMLSISKGSKYLHRMGRELESIVTVK